MVHPITIFIYPGDSSINGVWVTLKSQHQSHPTPMMLHPSFCKPGYLFSLTHQTYIAKRLLEAMYLCTVLTTDSLLGLMHSSSNSFVGRPALLGSDYTVYIWIRGA